MYQSLHKKRNRHQKASDIDIKMKRQAALGIAVAGTGLAAVGVSGATASASVTQTPTNSPKTQQSAKTQQQIEAEALVVIHGDLGNGQDRVNNLQKAGFDAQAVQDQVNKDYVTLGLGGAESAANTAVANGTAQQAAAGQGTVNTGTPAAPAAAPAASYNGSDVVGYAAQQMANNTGIPASQWQSVIMRESSGNPSAVNASSGAVGLFQLLGHGEYPGMSVDQQVQMATNVYDSQGAGAWAETW